MVLIYRGRVRFSTAAHRLLASASVMRKRHLVVGLVMFMASTVSYSSLLPVSPTVVMAADESVDVETTANVAPVGELSNSVPLADTTLMFASGVVLFGLAAGVRRHIS
jgi:hypothetical protein